MLYYSQHPNALSHDIITPSMSLYQARIMVAAFLVSWSLIAELWRPINPFYPIEALFGAIFLNKEQRLAWNEGDQDSTPKKQNGSGKARKEDGFLSDKSQQLRNRNKTKKNQ